MPTVLRIDGFDVRIYLPEREHGPAHVHVIRGASELVVCLNRLGENVSVREATGMNRRDIYRAVAIVEEHAEFLREQWRQYHG